MWKDWMYKLLVTTWWGVWLAILASGNERAKYPQMQGLIRFFSQVKKEPGILCCYHLYCSFTFIFSQVTSSLDNLGEHPDHPVLLFSSLSYEFCAICLSSDWLWTWWHHIPAQWIGLIPTCLPQCPRWLKCLNHCWVEAGAHLKGKRASWYINWHITGSCVFNTFG